MSLYFLPVVVILFFLGFLLGMVLSSLKKGKPIQAPQEPEKKEKELEISPQQPQQTQPIQPTQPAQPVVTLAVSPITPNQQEELQEETVLANIGEGLVIIDKLGKIVTFNKAAQALLGYTQQEALGKNFADIVKIDFDNKIDAKNETLGHQSSIHFVRKDGTKFPVGITTSSYVQGDNILGTITLFRDVTAEKNNDKKEAG